MKVAKKIVDFDSKTNPADLLAIPFGFEKWPRMRCVHWIGSRQPVALWALGADFGRGADFILRHLRQNLRARTHRDRISSLVPRLADLLAMDGPGGTQEFQGLPLRLQDWWLLGLCGLFLAGDLVFWHWSLHTTSVANATAAALVGISFGHGQRPFLGDLLGVIVGAFCAGYIMLVGRLRGRISTATVMGISDIATCLALLPIALAAGESLTAHRLHGWVVLFALAWLS